jgi:hypothetical protein
MGECGLDRWSIPHHEARAKAASGGVALYCRYYHVARVHQTRRVTPAREAGFADHVWAVKGIVALL